ncbi:MAG: citramalate synthase [Mariprofundaceae bacterium]
MKRRIQLFDTTLRDGCQSAEISLSSEDKVRIANRLADFSLDWIEGGWPGASPKDDRFFSLMKNRQWQSSQLVAFGCTAKPGRAVEEDRGLRHLIQSGADAACIFGKSSALHATKALRISTDENLALVCNSIRYLKQHFATVLFDAEHFFDGYLLDQHYAFDVLAAAADAGADTLVLCDTNGGSLPEQVEATVAAVAARFPHITLGIHAHNDSEMAVANSLAAVRAGVNHVQGTINGLGERCGNSNLISLIAILTLKMDIDCGIPEDKVSGLTGLSRFVNEMANLDHWRHQPFVGANAFAHKGGIHVSAVRKASSLYEHLPPASVGNQQRVLISDQAGRSNILFKSAELGLGDDLDPDDQLVQDVVARIKELENKGYAFEGAEASFHLLVLKAMKKFQHYFELDAFRVIDSKREHDGQPEAEATVMIHVGDQFTHTASLGSGPINAIDSALRAALLDYYPMLEEMRLTDYKVRVLTTTAATCAAVRVMIESTDGKHQWGTVGVSENIIDASYHALIDAFEYKLVLDRVPFPKKGS